MCGMLLLNLPKSNKTIGRTTRTQEGEPITLELPKRNASVYMASHFYLDDFPQSSEPLSDEPMPHTHVNPAEAFEADDEGYRGQPFPRPPREMLRQRSFFSDSSSDFGGVDPAQALRMAFGLNPIPLPRPQGQSSGSEGSRISRQSRSDRAEPSFDQLRSDLELA